MHIANITKLGLKKCKIYLPQKKRKEEEKRKEKKRKRDD